MEGISCFQIILLVEFDSENRLKHEANISKQLTRGGLQGLTFARTRGECVLGGEGGIGLRA